MKTPKSMPLATSEQISHKLGEIAASLDELSAGNFEKLVAIRKAKLANLEIEYERMQSAPDPDRLLIQELSTKIQSNSQFHTILTLEAIRSKIKVPDITADICLLHGLVYSKEFKSLPGLNVGLYDKTRSSVKKFGSTRTDKNGYFELQISEENILPLRRANNSTETDARSANISYFIGVSDKEEEVLFIEEDPIEIQPGSSIYREIYLV